ncbi:hypothetical protein FJZ18_02810 [Candidatus Pacearchaeota archaeon]|nr:hypothetical protein [Candidatus Pacearchaeota archaeon]
MKIERTLYVIGSVLLFIGLIWLFLPHVYHNQALGSSDESHYMHILEGVIVVFLGLITLIASTRKKVSGKKR